MKRVRVRGDTAELTFTLDELDVLRNGLNEARRAIRGEADFQTRLGVTRDEARDLIHELISVIEEMLDSQKGNPAAASERALGG